MKFNFSKSWLARAVQYEEGCNISAGFAPKKFNGLRIYGEDLRIFVDKIYGYSNRKSVRIMTLKYMVVDKEGNFGSNSDGTDTPIQASTIKMPENIHNIIDIIRYIVDTYGSKIPTRIYLYAIFDDDITHNRYARFATYIPKGELP